MFRHFGAWPHETHIPHEHIQQLRQLIKLQSAKKRADRGESLIFCSRDGIVRTTLSVFHCSELQNRKDAIVSPGSLLQEKDRTARCEADCQSDYEEDRK